jgi:hypothetical protein
LIGLLQVLNHKEPYCCPACRQPIYKLEVLGRHLRGCCPDLLSPQVRLLWTGDLHLQYITITSHQHYAMSTVGAACRTLGLRRAMMSRCCGGRCGRQP